MAENKKISELDQIQSLSNDDEFMVVDKSTTSGQDASSSGKTTRVTLNQLKEAVSASGAKGERGEQGAQGAQGAQGPQGSLGAQGASGTSGQKGSTGATGAQGAQGPKGDQGAQGAVGVGQKGATGATGSGGQKGQTGSNGSNGATGQKGATGATGSGGQKGATGAKGTTGSPGSHGNVNHQHRFQQTNGTVDPTGQKLRKTSGGGNVWNTQILTTNSYANGCYVSFSTEGYPTMMLGLNQGNDVSTNSYQTLDYCWYVHENKMLATYESGKGSGAGTYSPADILTITYDNHSIRYLQNGEIKRTVVVGSGKRFHMDSSLHMHGKTDWATSMLAFGPSGSVGANGVNGAKGQKGQAGSNGTNGAKGQKGAVGVGQKGAVGVGQKGAAGASGVFSGGTVSSPIKITGSTHEKIVLDGATTPYIRFREGGTNKAYIQWHTNGQLYLVNSETGTNCTVANDRFTVNTRFGYMQIGAMNSSHAHFYTDRGSYYFNKTMYVHGDLLKYGTSGSYMHSSGGTFTGTTYFNANALRVKQSMHILNEKGHTHTYLSQDSNGFTRVAGQYGVGFIGRGVQDAGKGVDSAELGRFTSMVNDLQGSSLLKIGCNLTNRPMARLDVGAHGCIWNRNGHYGDAMYLSMGTKFVHDGKDYRWSNSLTGHSSIIALARNGIHMWNSGKSISPGQTVAYREDFHLNVHGNLHIRGGYHKLSDVREKKNIKSLNKIESLNKVLELNPVTFEWKDESIKGEKLGLIAQEVEAIVPSVVDENDPSTPCAGQKPEPSRKSVDYESLVPLLISSIQNQQQQINDLKRQLNSK